MKYRELPPAAMSIPAAPDDVLLYEDVLRLLEEEELALAKSDQFQERRGSERCHYVGWQLIAPYENRRPRQHEFKFVQCRDLSAGGFSFLTDELEPAEEFVIALGTAPFRFFVARVTNRRVLSGEKEHRTVVGCRFVRGLV